MTDIVVRALTETRWRNFEAVFDAKGCSVARGCSCMCYRRSAAATVPAGLMRAQANRAELRAPVDGAITYEKKRGAARPEAYPVDCDARRRDDAMRLGAKSMYDTAGVTEVGRRKPHRPIARLTIS